jgi:CRISPR-associated exonuclease Cas4
MNSYAEQDLLMISGIQHFSFCRRQWALIHIENQWQENLRTTEGNIIHERCHDEMLTEKRNELLVSRGMRVFSHTIGIVGQCDVVEFTKAEEGVILAGREGYWHVCPIEYKRGKQKNINADRLQLCCQALCLEEMLLCEIGKGFLYYNESRRREEIVFTKELRDETKRMLLEMHEYYKRGYTPKSKPKKGCKSCSLVEVCIPKLIKHTSVNSYLHDFLDKEE